MRKAQTMIISIVLSAVFSYALLYSTLELPHILNKLLEEVIPHYGIGEMEEAERFVNSLRPLGYLCLVTIILLIVLGFTLKKYKISFLGSFILLLPTFSYFASVMFFLAGVGILRIIWLPFLEFFPGSSIYEKISTASNLLELGDIVYLPYDALRFLLNIVVGEYLPGIDEMLFLITIIASSIIFFISCATWFYFRFQNLGFAKSLVYKYSRHPQYFSFLLWSYGLLIYDKYIFLPPRGGYFAPPPFFWNVFALLLIGIALSEEKKMLEIYGEEYEKYRFTTPFMIPLSKTIGRIITLPVKLVFKKTYPERTKEIALTLAIYFIIILAVSMLY
ncbi:MAG: hypothetical protein QXN75_04215 [Thermoproteota archaeon]|nr:hypothetical protein [Candidatus Brockarchaeota archaeon]